MIGLTGYRVFPIGKHSTKVNYYVSGALWKAWIVNKAFNGGDIELFLRCNESIEQFVIDYDTISDYLI